MLNQKVQLTLRFWRYAPKNWLCNIIQFRVSGYAFFSYAKLQKMGWNSVQKFQEFWETCKSQFWLNYLCFLKIWKISAKILDGPCASDLECKTAFAACTNGICQCQSGFGASGQICQPTVYSCPYGDPLKDGNSVKQCERIQKFEPRIPGKKAFRLFSLNYKFVSNRKFWEMFSCSIKSKSPFVFVFFFNSIEFDRIYVCKSSFKQWSHSKFQGWETLQ